jgi:hypothetical protein
MLNRSTPARRLVLAATAILLLTALGGSALADPTTCAVTGGDAAAVADARAVIHAACDCDGASSSSFYRRCVRETLAPLVGNGLSASCRTEVLRIETRSTCGKPERVVCCQTSRSGITRPKLVRDGRCLVPRGGSACVSESDFFADACTTDGCAAPPTSCGDGVVDDGEQCDPPNSVSCSATCTICLPDGCIAPSSCGDGTVDAGEGCDPPDGTTCSSGCTSCAPASPGEILIGCSSGSTGVDASALASTMLLAYTDTTPGGGNHVVAKRVASDGTVLDAAALAVSALLPGTDGVGGFTHAATSDGQSFYVGWSTFSPSVPMTYFGGRAIPASGPIAAAPDLIAQNLLFGFCHVAMAGPLELAPRLAGGGFQPTWRNIYGCGADVYFENLTGVGNFFAVPPPGNITSGPAPIVRGASDVAAVWWNGFVSSVSPPMIEQFLAASFVEPGTPTMILLSHGFSPVSPALAVVGDTFVALWANGDELRAARFTRAAGALDPDGGVLLASGGGTIGSVAAAGDGTTVLAAWTASTGPTETAIRALRIAPDGTVPNPTPIAVATSDASPSVSVAANATAALVAFTRAEAAGSSVRAVRIVP